MEFSGVVIYKNKIINIAIILLALIISYNVYKKQLTSIEQLKQAKEQEVRKNEVLNSISQLEKKIDLYKNFANKKDISSIMNRLGIIANESGVKIISLRPMREVDSPVYVKYPFQMSVIANDYDTIGKFIANLENNDDFYIVESVGIRNAVSYDNQASGNDGFGKLTLELKISTVLFK